MLDGSDSSFNFKIGNDKTVKFLSLSLLQITPAKDGKPVIIELIDAKTKELKDTLEVSFKCLLQKHF